VAAGRLALKFTPPPVVVLMGVSGCGKSTVGRLLADRLGWPMLEGDDLHPAANVEKMAHGRPLTDDDRWPWLAAIRTWIDARISEQSSAVVTCSALRHSYRDVLRDPHVVFVQLDGPRELLLARLAARHGHFMPAALLDSQLSALEPPDRDEQAVRIDISLDVADQVDAILAALTTGPTTPATRRSR
jgi:carbohydrate kinase (thermoresistant glucokinase family)